MSNDHINSPYLIAAHEHSIRNRTEVEASVVCECFYCLSIFPSSAITQWSHDGQTARCPKCMESAVIGSASGYPFTHEFLQSMHNYWF